MSTLGTRFDWYEATWDGWGDTGEMLSAAGMLSVVLGGQVRKGKGHNGYSECEALVRGEDELLRVYSRSFRLGEVHIVITGESCDEVVPVFRRLWPDHRVSRADSAVDLLADFSQLDDQAVTFARGRGLSHRLITDSDGGATRYLGAPSSEVRVRVYKKSEQLRALHPERASEVPDGVVRVELQARPGKRAVKDAAALLDADGLWGMSQWGQVFASELLDFEAERVVTHFRRPSDRERALHFMMLQYGRTLREMAAELGWDAALARVGEMAGRE